MTKSPSPSPPPPRYNEFIENNNSCPSSRSVSPSSHEENFTNEHNNLHNGTFSLLNEDEECLSKETTSIFHRQS